MGSGRCHYGDRVPLAFCPHRLLLNLAHGSSPSPACSMAQGRWHGDFPGGEQRSILGHRSWGKDGHLLTKSSLEMLAFMAESIASTEAIIPTMVTDMRLDGLIRAHDHCTTTAHCIVHLLTMFLLAEVGHSLAGTRRHGWAELQLHHGYSSWLQRCLNVMEFRG